MFHKSLLKSLAVLALTSIRCIRAAANQLVQITADIGPNPNGVGMYLYTPSNLANPLPLIVAIHACTETGPIYFESTQYATLADTYGFLVVYPSSPRSGTCFDVNTAATLTHDGGGDSQGIASMVTYSIATYGVSASHVYVTGTSSGAMMTNVMSGSYPELFQAASIYSGVAFGCFAGTSSWNTACADGDISMTGAQWAALVYAAYPDYTGSRPKMMIWHGTVDTTLYYENFSQEILQWTTVLGVSSTPTTTTLNDPQTDYTMTTYGSEVVAYSAAGVGHTVPVHETIDLAWFGITSTTSTTTLTTTNSGTTTTPTATTSTATATGTPTTEYMQCGGIGWTGATSCVSPYTCQVINAYYFQCLPA
ncbi:hypothetical protein FRB97_002154 [Tulasnella sp. 331]|nr:hypothetical protein FRB97_002154 [Tulasnella sp. 331]KAG8885559.1 hypothetical protein FRB98_001749 [Tulasnella sp. 332]